MIDHDILRRIERLENRPTPSDLTVVIVTNGRCPPLLGHIIECWKGKASVLVRHCREPHRYSDILQEALEETTTPYVLQSGDDIIPVGHGWPEFLDGDVDGIRAVRLLDVEGRRWFDWATWREGEGATLQDYGCRAHSEPSNTWTYITGGAQLIGRDVIRSVSYRGRGFGKAGDVFYCLDAMKAGHKLHPPAPDGPTLIHLERRWPGAGS